MPLCFSWNFHIVFGEQRATFDHCFKSKSSRNSFKCPQFTKVKKVKNSMVRLMQASKGILNLPTSSLNLCSPFQQQVKIHHVQKLIRWRFTIPEIYTP